MLAQFVFLKPFLYILSEDFFKINKKHMITKIDNDHFAVDGEHIRVYAQALKTLYKYKYGSGYKVPLDVKRYLKQLKELTNEGTEEITC